MREAAYRVNFQDLIRELRLVVGVVVRVVVVKVDVFFLLKAGSQEQRRLLQGLVGRCSKRQVAVARSKAFDGDDSL